MIGEPSRAELISGVAGRTHTQRSAITTATSNNNGDLLKRYNNINKGGSHAANGLGTRHKETHHSQ